MVCMKKLFLCSALCFFFAAFLSAKNFSVRFEMDPRLDKSLFSFAELPTEPFMRSALLASGAGQEESERHLKALEALRQELSARLSSLQSEEEKADAILFFIYEKLLSKYDFYQTRVDLALESGVYNCVSSAIIFMYFCKAAGIPVVANETPRHAFCSIFQDGQAIDVETTNPYGVNPGKKRGQNLGGGKSQWITVPAKNYSGRRQVDDRRTVAMVYNNRISQLQRKKQDAQTVGLAVDAYELQGHSAVSRNDLELCVGNVSALLTREGREQEAVAFLRKAEKIFGSCDSWTKKISNNYYNWALKKIKSESLEESWAFLDENKENFSQKDFAELKEAACLTAAASAAGKRDWRAAIAIVDQGLKELGQSKRLQNSKSAYRQNVAIDFHNAAADLFNAGKKDEALEKIKEGLAEMPDNKILLSDLSKMSN